MFRQHFLFLSDREGHDLSDQAFDGDLYRLQGSTEALRFQAVKVIILNSARQIFCHPAQGLHFRRFDVAVLPESYDQGVAGRPESLSNVRSAVGFTLCRRSHRLPLQRQPLSVSPWALCTCSNPRRHYHRSRSFRSTSRP